MAILELLFFLPSLFKIWPRIIQDYWVFVYTSKHIAWLKLGIKNDMNVKPAIETKNDV